MDMLKRIETQPLTAAALSAATDLCEAEGDMSPIEIATSRRMLRALEAAEKMADAIEAYRAAEDKAPVDRSDAEVCAWGTMIDAADAFRKAMRGEL